MRGSHVMRRIREHEAAGRPARRATLVSCTAQAAIGDELERIRACGADAIWSKPLPDFLDGSLQREMAAILARNAPRSSTLMR